MITFLAPVFAWLLPLALLPVVFHLFFRIRKQPRVFPSLLFFLAADPRLSARRRLREWLVLLLRVLALAMLLLALARPVRRGWGGEEAHVTVVIDNSASMAATDADGQSRLSRALAAATAVLQDRAVRQAAVATTVRDAGVALPAGFVDDLASVRAALAAIRATHASGDAAGALRQAAALSRGVLRGSVEIHIFSDFQATEWGAASAPVAFPPGTAVVVHDVGRSGDRAGAVALLPPTTMPPRQVAGRPWRLPVHLRNYGVREAEAGVNLSLGDTRLRQVAAVAAGQTRQLRLPLPALPPGEHSVRIWLDGAAAGPGAESWQVVRVTPPDDVWFVGDERAYGVLGFALAPAADGALTGLRVKAVPDLAGALRAAGAVRPVLVAVTRRGLADGQTASVCRDYAAGGGSLLISPEPEADSGAGVVLPEWCGVDVGKRKTSEPGEPLVVFVPEHALWDDLRDEQGAVNLHGVSLRQWLPLAPRPREGAVALAGTPDGAAALTRTVVGRGVVYVSGCAWDLRWSNLPRRAAFLPLALALARPVQPEEPAAQVAQAGSPFAADRRLATGNPGVRLRTVAGDVVAWSGRADGLVTPARAGIYRVEGLAQPLTLAVAGAPAESVPTLAAARNLALLAGTDYRVFTYRTASESASDVQAARHGQSLFGILAALAALFWLLELWLSNQRPAMKR
jgi:hypothetical protein